MNIKEMTGKKIQELRNQKSISITKFSYAVGISYTHLKKIEDGITSVGIETLQSICDALDISLSDFFNEEYFNNTHTDSLFKEINRLSESERVAFLDLIAEINKYK